MDMKRRSILLLFFLSINALLLSGCWDRVEVNDLAIITAAGFDLTEDHQVELSVKIYVTSDSSSQQTSNFTEPSGGAAGLSVIRSAKGKTAADAASKLQQVISRTLFWGQDEVFIFGEKLAKEGLVEPMEFLLRFPATREQANVFVSKGTAKEVLLLNPPINRSIADALRKMAKLQTELNITLKELAQMMAGRAKAAVLPLVEINQGLENYDAFPYINGSAILKNGKMVGRLNIAATRGTMWLRDEVKSGTVTVTPKNAKGIVSFQLLKSHTDLIPHINGNDWGITVRIDTKDDVVENTTDLDLSVPKHIEEMETELGDDIKHRVNMALTLAQKELKADIFRFADAFYRKYPKEWLQNKDRWEEIYPNVKVIMETNAKISRPGLTNKNIFIPNQR